MAKTRPQKKSKKRHKSVLNGVGSMSQKKINESPSVLFDNATTFLQTGQPEAALGLVERALQIAPAGSLTALRSLNLIAEIHVELGNVDAAREYFKRAVAIDPEGEIPEPKGGGVEKFLWLAQLSEEGGADSVKWYEKGVTILKRHIQSLEESGSDGDVSIVEEQKQKLAHALCGVVEVYMTDLSWEQDAESKCESLVTEALLVAPESPQCLQTLASVRISQLRPADARAALTRSLDLWKDLPPESPGVPDFPTRISLTRLLMEVQMENEALEVLERMVLEDDQSVETWYLGGWCLYLLGGRGRGPPSDRLIDTESEPQHSSLRSSRTWLRQAMKLYDLLNYEDEKLKEHALELIQELNRDLCYTADDSENDEGKEDYREDETDSANECNDLEMANS